MRGKFHPSNFITHNINLHANVTELKRTHALLLKLTKPHILHHFLTRLLARLLYFPQKNLFYARNLFDQTPITKDQFTWTSLIRSHVHHGQFRLSISLYTEMHRASVFPSGFTFSSLLTACACIPAISEGKQAHSMIEKLGFLANRIVKTALLDMYAKCGCLLEAEDVFITIDDKDIITWTAMIRGYAKMGMMSNARKLFDEMPQRNSVTWATMVSGYANCGEMREAKKLFDVMPERNMVSLVAVIAGYGKEGDVVEARKFFDGVEMERDVSCWAAMVACYAQNGYGKEAIDIYKKMKKEAVGMNEVAMVGAISACAQLGDFEMARVLAEDVEVKCCDLTPFVSNALIHMHSKCSSIDQAREEFNKMRVKDVISYTTLITAFADHGKAKEALDLFSKMQEEGIKPNQRTFIAVLNACSHGGLIEEACKYFKLMTQVFKIEPLKEHYACLVDVLGRDGQVEKAYEIVREKVKFADEKIWGSLLAACKAHGYVELGEVAAKNLFEIEPENRGNYVLLANAYASGGNWCDAERVRKMMSGREMRTSPGCSWIRD